MVIKRILGSSQHSNSVFLIVAQGLVTVFGYMFWVVVSRRYSSSDVGVASALISSTILISQISILGLNQSLVRFLPNAKNSTKVIDTFIFPTLIASAFVSSLWYILVVSSALTANIRVIYGALFIVSSMLATMNLFTDSIFLAKRSTSYNMVIYGAYGMLRMALPFLLPLTGVMGIFVANLLGTLAAVVLSFYFINRAFGYMPGWRVSMELLKSVRVYSLANYVAGFSWMAPMLLAPTIVLHMLHASSAAYLYIAVTIFSMLLTLSTATSQSLFAEASHNAKEVITLAKKSLAFTYVVQTVAVFMLMVLSTFILSTFGREYISGGELLRLLALSSLITTLNITHNSVLKATDRIVALVLINMAGAVMTILGIVLAVNAFGLIGVGMGYLLGQSAMLGIAGVGYVKSRRHGTTKAITLPGVQ